MAEIKSPTVVWVLGAGFSRSLGGPLIQDLLAHRDLPVLRTLFPEENYAGIAEEQFKARLFCRYGQERRYWDHAEQFLDLVETAEMEATDDGAVEPSQRHAPSYGRSFLTSMLKDVVRYPPTQIIEQGGGVNRYQKEVPGPPHNFESLAALASASRRALAVDCSAFLRAAQLDTERWSPYTWWATKLDPHHGVVTFNYDHVPELLASHRESRLRVIVPTGPLGPQLRAAQEAQQVPVLKVHGSVTWRADGAAGTVMKLADPALGDPRTDVMIGVPGPRKRSLIGERLDPFWRTMLDWLIAARQVIFVGYRFPPTDADSRSDILEAIRSGSPSDKRVQTVLGPRLESDDSIRLRHLLLCSGTGAVVTAPLLAEDYLALWPHSQSAAG